jgi:hypothetical protein
MLSELIEQLNSLNLDKLDTVVLDLMSNTAFMGTDASGLPSEPIRTENGNITSLARLQSPHQPSPKEFLLNHSP